MRALSEMVTPGMADKRFSTALLSTENYSLNTHTHTHTVEPDEIKRLSRSFKKLDLNQNGSLSVDEFMSIPELQQNPLVRRVIDILDTDRNGEVDFQGGQRLMLVLV